MLSRRPGILSPREQGRAPGGRRDGLDAPTPPGGAAHWGWAWLCAGPRHKEVISHEPWRVSLKTDLDGATHRADERCHDAATARGGPGETRTPGRAPERYTRRRVSGRRRGGRRHRRVAPDPD